MCGILGFNIEKTEKNIEIILNLFKESTIRGLHSIGISLINKEGKLITEKTDKIIYFLDNLKEFISKNSKEDRIIGIGHTRYSTSFLLDFQPISDDNFSLCLNGVVTQKDKKYWNKDFNVNCITNNDAEILFQLRKNNKRIEEIINSEKFGSIAVLEINNSCFINFYRNAFRPLWFTQLSNGSIVGSTRDIISRTLKTDDNIEKCVSGWEYSIDKSGNIFKIENKEYKKDLQIQELNYKELKL